MEEKTEKPEIGKRYHCWDDVCFIVRIPKVIATETSEIDSDTSIHEYIKKRELESREEAATTRDKETKIEVKPRATLRRFKDGKCLEFSDRVTFAKNFVRDIIFKARAATKNILYEPENDEADSSADSADFSVADIYFSGWPTVGTFSAEIGCDKIEEYLASFFTDEDWTFAVHYNGSQDKPTSCLHNYEAIFGLPTASYPIPQATASVYFTIEVSRIQPPQCLVDVTFTYETSRRINRPGVHDFHEKWLLDILEAKIKFFQTITY
ncbi:uncharacterized protein LOC132699607 isoform X2 [Cylas formicarius]|uniref:uncharacterized protein LOC132699607 isoform X2 n=1 Tax=Cylas formicarius TaxID=197179 RepID=UPI0029585141|nr:uncharacterized protein LOC132699607 isoform X2 [Cylas formicarius]